MTTINAPVNWAQMENDTGMAFVFASDAIRLALMDGLNVLDLGIMPLIGDLAGQGADTIRVTHMGSVGFARRMTALATETDSITPSAVSTGYSEIAVGIYGLGHEETYHHQILRRAQSFGLKELVELAPQSWLATIRYLMCVEGATFSTAVGSASTDASVDDYLDLVTAHNETLGATGNPGLIIKPRQHTNLLESFRAEPAFQNSAADFAALQKINGMQRKGNVAGLGIDVSVTDDVQTSGGAYQGFSFSPGGMGWARASTTPIQPANPGAAMYIPEFGIFIERHDRGQNGKAAYEARAWLGVDSGSTDRFVLRRFISQT